MPEIPNWVQVGVRVRPVPGNRAAPALTFPEWRIDGVNTQRPIHITYRQNTLPATSAEQYTATLNDFVHLFEPIDMSYWTNTPSFVGVLIALEAFPDGSVVQLWRVDGRPQGGVTLATGHTYQVRTVEVGRMGNVSSVSDRDQAEVVYLTHVREKMKKFAALADKEPRPPPPIKKSRFDREDPV